MGMCSVCLGHDGAGSYCHLCRPLYQKGRKRMNERKNEFNISLQRDPKAFDAALVSGLLKEEKYGYDKNHNFKLLPKPRIVWAHTAWDYVTEEEIQAAHAECGHTHRTKDD